MKNWEWVTNVFPNKPDWISDSYWALENNEKRTALIGERVELFSK